MKESLQNKTYNSINVESQLDENNSASNSPQVHRVVLYILLGIACVIISVCGLFVAKEIFPDKKLGDYNNDSIYKNIIHPMQPTPLWGVVQHPYPTNAFWTNLVVNDQYWIHDDNYGAGPVGIQPYGVSTTISGVSVSYGAMRRVVTQLAITDNFDEDILLSSVEPCLTYAVSRYDNLSVSMTFAVSGGSYTAPLVKASPFITVVYDNATPVVSSEVMMITGVTPKVVEGVVGTFYLITLGNYENWLVYCSAPVSFDWNGNTLTGIDALLHIS